DAEGPPPRSPRAGVLPCTALHRPAAQGGGLLVLRVPVALLELLARPAGAGRVARGALVGVGDGLGALGDTAVLGGRGVLQAARGARPLQPGDDHVLLGHAVLARGLLGLLLGGPFGPPGLLRPPGPLTGLGPAAP